MKNFLKYFIICALGYILLHTSVLFAANIDSTNKWAWGTNIGWVNFNPILGNVIVTSTGVTGNAWSTNYGWIDMQPTNGGITNTVSGLNGVGVCKGTLRGDAWNTNLGWINFDGVSIDENGYFSGTATGTNSGPISMSGSLHVVQTEWTPDCVPPATPVCTTSPASANDGTVVTTTCTGIEVGATVTIPDMVCSPSPATSTTVVCQGTVGTGSGQVSTPDDTVTVTDEAGNTNTDETTGLSIDNTLPAAPAITSPTDGEDTNDSTPTLTGTGTPGDTITVTGPLGETCTVIVDVNGDWSCDISPALAEGPNVITATATDPAGNVSPATSITIDVDTIAPVTPTIANPVNGLVTNNNTPTINGTGEPGTEFTLTDAGGALIGTGVVDPSGNWSLVPTTDFPDGNNTLNVTTTDDAGNISPSATTTFEIDTLVPPPPTITTPVDGSTTTDNTPDITGTGEPGSIFTITNASGAIVGTGVVDPSGNYALTPTLALPDGTNTLSVVLADDAGNESTPVSTTFTVDTTSPTTPVAPDLQATSDTGDSDTDDTTSDTTPTFDVACTEIGSTITLYSSGSSIGTHTCTTVGIETITPAPALADGAYNVAYTETDPAGNESPLSPDLTITVDSTAPLAPLIENPVVGLFTNDNTPVINGTAEPNSTITVTNASGAIIGTTTTNSSGDWTFTPTIPLDDGGHVVNATATDSSGNVSPLATTTFTVDTLAPTPLVLETPIDGSISNDNTPDITGTGEPGTVFTITDGNGTLVGTGVIDLAGDWSLTPTTPLSDGLNTLDVTLTDAANNVSGPLSTTFTVDTMAPTTPSAAPDLQPGSDTGSSDTDDTTSDATPTFDVVCTELGSTITLYTDNPSADTVAGTHVCTGIGTETITASPALTDGVHNITYTQTDIAGNESALSPALPVTIDTTAPETQAAPDLQSTSDLGSSDTDDLTSDTTPTLDTTCTQVGAIITLYDGITPVGTHMCTAVGPASITPTLPLGSGVYDFNTTETDIAGNKSSPSPNLVVTIDAGVPTITLVGPKNLTQNQGTLYIEQFATCVDDDSCIVTLSGSVDTSSVVTSVITYTATDPSGNTASVVREVSITPIGGGTGSPGGSGGGGNGGVSTIDTPPEPEIVSDPISDTEPETSIPEEEVVSQPEEESTPDPTSEPETISDPVSETESEENTTKMKTAVGDREVNYSLTNTFDGCPIIRDINDQEYSYPNSGVFVDEGQSVYKDLILKFAEIGIVDGTVEGNFEPKRAITRSEFTKMVLISHCYKYRDMDPSDLQFSDVDKSSWQAKVIRKALELGIINGDIDEAGNAVFRPNDVISKAEATKILMRMAFITVDNPIPLGYGDIEVNWHVPYVQTGETLGIFDSGKDSNVFDPEGTVNRDEMIYLIYKTVLLYRGTQDTMEFDI